MKQGLEERFTFLFFPIYYRFFFLSDKFETLSLFKQMYMSAPCRTIELQVTSFKKEPVAVRSCRKP